MASEILSTLTGFTGDKNIRQTARNILPFPKVDSFPEQMKHGAVNFRGTIYEFNTGDGIVVSPDAVTYKRNYDAQVCSTFVPSKEQEDFDEWIISQSVSFRKDNYDMIRNNCTHFVTSACEFLQIPVPEVFTKQQAFLEEHEADIQLIAPVLSQSRQTQPKP